MSKLNVLIGEDIGLENLERLKTTFPDVVFNFCPDVEPFIDSAAEANVVFTKRFPPQAFQVATKLQWVQAGTAGVDRLLDMGLRDRSDIQLTNATGAHGAPISELILSMMLAFATGLHTLIRAQQKHSIVKQQVITEKFELEGQTLGIIGLGDIGGSLAKKAQGLNMRVLGVRRSQEPFPHVDAQYTPEQLDEVLPQVDHLALCLPLTPQTQDIIGEAELRAMKSSAYIYNVGRGESIEPNALLQALRSGWIAGAGLDVTAPEPLPEDSPLWALNNVLIGQHTSGSSPYNADRITTIFLKNLERFQRGEELQGLIDKTLGY